MLRVALQTLFVALTLTPAAHAMCSSSGLTAWPPAGPIGEGPLIAVTGHAADRVVARAHRARVRLVDLKTGHTVPLAEVAAPSAGYQSVQVLLEPIRPLERGRQYRLEFQAPRTWQAGKIIEDAPFAPASGPDGLPIVWTVADQPSSGGPKWTAAPTDAAVVTQFFGCGPAVSAQVPVAADGAAGFLVELEGGSGTQQALLVPRDGALTIGHGMCSGPFSMGQPKYAAVLVPVDATGRQGQARTITLTAANGVR